MFSSVKLLAVGLLLSATPVAATAQDVLGEQESDIRRLQAELDVKIEEWRAADESAWIADSLRALEHGASKIDSTRVGLFTIVTREDRTESYVDAARQAWAHFEPYISDVPEEARDGLEGTSIGIYLSGRASRTQGTVWIRQYHTPGERVRRIAAVMDQQLAGRVPGTFKWWGRSLGLARADESRDPWTYRALLTSQSKVAQGCFDGNLNDCWRALGALDGQRWWEAWYHPHQLRMRILKLWNPDRLEARDPEWFEDFAACVERNDDQACVDIVRDHSSVVTNALRPLDASARESLTALALRMGGARSYARLIEDRDGGPREHLAYVAGTTETELIRSWRDQIMAARPKVAEGTAGTGAATLAWIILLGAIATRSTRWRM